MVRARFFPLTPWSLKKLGVVLRVGVCTWNRRGRRRWSEVQTLEVYFLLTRNWCTTMEYIGSKYELLVYIVATLATIWALSRLVFSDKKLNLPPGPRGWPILGNLTSLGTHPQITLTNMAKVYGPILYLRLGQKDCIVVSSPELAEEFLKNHDSNFSGRPHMIHADILEYGSQGTS